MIYSRHNNTTTIILINNNYTVLTSIKDDEHKLRTSTHTILPNIYPKEAEKFPTPSQFKRIILKSENKVRLQKKNIRFAKKYHFLGGYCPNFQVKFRQWTPLALLVWNCHGNFSREA